MILGWKFLVTILRDSAATSRGMVGSSAKVADIPRVANETTIDIYMDDAGDGDTDWARGRFKISKK